MGSTTLVDPETLEEHLSDPGWIVFDCRHDLARPEAGEADYRAGHIPGAHFMHLERDLSGHKNGRNGRHPLPEPQVLCERLAAAGVSPGIQAVAYDAQNAMNAARLWWLMRWLGHDAVAVLDGGWPLWLEQGRPVTSHLPERRRGTFAGRPRSDMTLEAGRLQGKRLLDARAPNRFRGENETLDPVGGRIPGARNRFFADNIEASGRFKPAGVLAQELAGALGTAEPAEVVHYCGSGVSACQNLLAMEIAGLKGSRLYPGSWSEWCADRSRPVARGSPAADGD